MLPAFCERLGLTIPLIQAPMAGITTPELAAAVSNAGALGSLGLGAANASKAGEMMSQLRSATEKPFNVNLFAHQPAQENRAKEADWITSLHPYFAEFDTQPPEKLHEIYRTFDQDPEMLALLLDMRPAVVSFHFGLPSNDAVQALKANGSILLASATSLEEAQAIEQAGLDAIIAQGIEAGGHRGIFDPDQPDERLGTFALTRLLVQKSTLPVIAAGGIMDGAGIVAALKLGAVAAQMGTAFIGCPESAADEAYRHALTGPAAEHTRLTRVISGRPARCIANRFTALEDEISVASIPDYPIAYDAGKALHMAAKAEGDYSFAASWAGQGAPLSRIMPVARLVETLCQELAQSL
ncbi:nitronate monooxygenase [Altericroceibacterium spongiae]|uniref:Nitronate monooxygenase n=1 Tax=Altericroceibacterium spongiae TaxID=2320269 RepID=A0A420ERG7_9SPHN|nr:nitronate monooxygenase [Altericroceibacterium spongiae]RKF23279.1 nitronate monooxygenase [Altericroceibacterium spongiae]